MAVITLDLKFDLWQNPNFPSLNILENHTKAVLEAFNKCRKLDTKLRKNDNTIKNFSDQFNSLTEERAVESLRLSMFAKDVVIYMELLSKESTSIEVILETLSSLLDTAQEREKITKELKDNYNQFFMNFDKEVSNVQANLEHDSIEKDADQNLFGFSNFTSTYWNFENFSRYFKSHFLNCLLNLNSLLWRNKEGPSSKNLSTSPPSSTVPNSTENSTMSNTSTPPAPPSSTVVNRTSLPLLQTLENNLLYRLLRKFFTQNKDHRPRSQEIPDDDDSCNKYIEQQRMQKRMQQQPVKKEKDDKILEIKKNLPVIIKDVEILYQFWDHQIINIKDHIENLKSVNKDEKIRIPQEIAMPIKEVWDKQAKACKENHARIKDLVTHNSIISFDD